MPVTTTSGIPCRIISGDTAIFTLSDSAHPASGWLLDFVLSRNGIKLSTTRATADGDNYAVTLTAALSASLAPGQAQWTLVYTERTGSPPQRDTGDSGWLIIAPDPAGSLTPTANQLALAACNAAIAGLVASPEQTVSFNGQSFTSRNIGDLFTARDRLQVLVNNELREMGISQKGGARLIRFRFA